MSGQLDTSLVFLAAKGVFCVCTKILIFQKSRRQESSHFAGLLVGPGFRALPGPPLLIRNGPLGVTENGWGSSVGRNEGGARGKSPWFSSRNSEVVNHSRGFPKEGGQCNRKMGKEERFSFSLSRWGNSLVLGEETVGVLCLLVNLSYNYRNEVHRCEPRKAGTLPTLWGNSDIHGSLGKLTRIRAGACWRFTQWNKCALLVFHNVIPDKRSQCSYFTV